MPHPNSSPGTAFVTGASSGIGRAFARRLAREGHDLVLVARRRDRLEALASELREVGVSVEVCTADLATDEGLQLAEQRLLAQPALTLLVNNAGFAHFGSFLEEQPVDAEAGVRVLVLATVRLTHAALSSFVKLEQGTVINISSRAAFGAHPELATYGAAKAYVNRFTQALADEFSDRGVRFLAVCPGNVRTELFERAGIDPTSMRGCLEPEQVVEDSLLALSRGERVCIPGERRRDRTLRQLLPRGAIGKLAGILARLSGH